MLQLTAAQLTAAILAVTSVGDSDPEPDPQVFGPPGSGSMSQRYGSPTLAGTIF